MTVLNYMAMQKNRVREKHSGETYLLEKDEEAVPVMSRSTYDILNEIDSMQGLNMRERYSPRNFEGAGC